MEPHDSPEKSSGMSSRRDALKLAGAVAVGGAAALAASTIPASAAPNGRFSVQINGVPVAGVAEVDGLETETEVIDYKDGDDATVRTRPGNHKAGKVTITKDWSNTAEFFRWRKEVIDGKVERKSISIIFQNDGAEQRINLFQCWPTKWKGPSLNARNSGHATESIEIVFERIELK